MQFEQTPVWNSCGCTQSLSRTVLFWQHPLVHHNRVRNTTKLTVPSKAHNADSNKLRMRVLCPAVRRPFKKSPCAPYRGSSTLGETRGDQDFQLSTPNLAIFLSDTRKNNGTKSPFFSTNLKLKTKLWRIFVE